MKHISDIFPELKTPEQLAADHRVWCRRQAVSVRRTIGTLKQRYPGEDTEPLAAVAKDLSQWARGGK